METQPLGKCKKHPRYKYSQPPKGTKAYPKGCPDCWELWNKMEAARVEAVKKEFAIRKKKRMRDHLKEHQVKPGEVLNPEGRNQHSAPQTSIHDYARKSLKNGKLLVDRLKLIASLDSNDIEDLIRNPATIKDQLDSIKTLYKMMKDDELGDKPQDVRVIVLNVKDATFEEYQRGSDSS